MRKVLIGIDAGGTQLRVQAYDILAQRVFEQHQLAAAPDGGPEPLEAILLSYGASCLSVCAGITKISRGEVKPRWEAALARWLPEAHRQVVADFVIAFHGAIASGEGILVIAGTGSVVYGESKQGQCIRVGGRGWEFGDEGSGAHLTSELLRRTVRACDGIAPETPLTQLVSATLGSQEAGVLAEAARQRALAEGRGFLVPLVLERAQAGDAEAQACFVGAAGWLARLVRTAGVRLALDTATPLVVATVGGMWEAGPLLYQPFEVILRRWFPLLERVKTVSSPCAGAVQLAARATR